MIQMRISLIWFLPGQIWEQCWQCWGRVFVCVGVFGGVHGGLVLQDEFCVAGRILQPTCDSRLGVRSRLDIDIIYKVYLNMLN